MSTAGAAQEQRTSSPEGGAQVPEEPGGGTGENDPLPGTGCCAAKHGLTKLLPFTETMCLFSFLIQFIYILMTKVKRIHSQGIVVNVSVFSFKLQEKRQLVWDQREVELEQQLDRFEKHRKVEKVNVVHGPR